MLLAEDKEHRRLTHVHSHQPIGKTLNTKHPLKQTQTNKTLTNVAQPSNPTTTKQIKRTQVQVNAIKQLKPRVKVNMEKTTLVNFG